MPDLNKILHVDDDPDIRMITRLSLENVGGYTVRQCSSGEEALACAAEFLPDLALLDVMMPDMTGDETSKRLQDVIGPVPVVFMTAKADRDTRTSLLALGAIGVIVKPFDPMKLAGDLHDLWAGATK